MAKKRKNYNEKAPYLVKKARTTKDRPICPICKKCLNKDFCNNRKRGGTKIQPPSQKNVVYRVLSS